MIRGLAFLYHRLVGEYWWRRSRNAMREARQAYGRNRLFVYRAEARDRRAERLYPPPATGPPNVGEPAPADTADARNDGP